MRRRGHKIIICARNKEITHQLLRNAGYEYHDFGNYPVGLWKRLQFIFATCRKARKIIKLEKIDYVIGIADMYGGLASKWTKAKSIVFTDTEHAKLINFCIRLFADKIVTPTCFDDDYGDKQVRHDGYHELAYLHPNYFRPDKTIIDDLGLQENERFFLVRFVAWNASHDVDYHGLTLESKLEIVKMLARRGTVFISAEGDLPAELEKFRYPASPNKMHDAIYFADLVVGDGGTTSSESAVLGTEAVYVSGITCGYLQEEANQYGMIHYFDGKTQKSQDKALQKVHELSDLSDLKRRGRRKAQQILADKIDVTRWMVEHFDETPSELNITVVHDDATIRQADLTG